jgi:hypothetical protein
METRLSKAEYEAHVLQTLRDYVFEKDPRVEGDGSIWIEDIRLDTSGPEHMVEVLLWDKTRPECRFGWRYPATEADESHAEWSAAPRGPEQAEIWAHTFVLTGLQEELEAVGYGLPDECKPTAVTWFGDYQP